MSVLELSDIEQMHIDKFGVATVVTGARWNDPEPLSERILEAISVGKPYVEEQLEQHEMS